MDFTFDLGLIDLVTIIAFLVVMVTLGCWVGWKQRKSACPGV